MKDQFTDQKTNNAIVCETETLTHYHLSRLTLKQSFSERLLLFTASDVLGERCHVWHRPGLQHGTEMQCKHVMRR